MEVTVSRHSVAVLPENGLSPLQQALLTDERPVRVAAAPTGAGKTYAFEWAVAKAQKDGEESRILFIVPTKRLAQNIVLGLISDLEREHGWSRDRAEKKVALWTGDAARDYYAAGGTEISVKRINQLYRLNDAPGGEMVVAVPEVVSYLLIGRFLKAGQASEGIFTILTQFDHIVFDEFHTIPSRGFGLAALCARLAAGNKSQRYGRAKVSFLSATPLTIKPVLERIGIDPSAIGELEEKIVDSGRPVHGDVRLILRHDVNTASMVSACLEDVRLELSTGGQVVVIYNSLGDLKRELPQMEKYLRQAGVQDGETLLINSIDDSTDSTAVHAVASSFFMRGRHHDPLDFKILIATASVEMGVTFQTRLLFMEPGFEPLNFLQRYGRAARGDMDGKVYVRLEDNVQARWSWLRVLKKWVAEKDGQRVDIRQLTDLLAQSTRERFTEAEPKDKHSFGLLSMRAAFASGLYWLAAMEHLSNKGARRQHLQRCQPSTAKTIAFLLTKVATMENDIFFGDAAKKWISQFKAQAKILRDIGAQIRVVDEDGLAQTVSLHWLAQQTDLLAHAQMMIDENGEEEFHIEGRLTDYILDTSIFVQRYRHVFFPHTNQIAVLEDNGFVVDQWCRQLRSDPEALEAWQDFPQAMQAAEDLTKYTGLIVENRDDISMETCSGIL